MFVQGIIPFVNWMNGRHLQGAKKMIREAKNSNYIHDTTGSWKNLKAFQGFSEKKKK